MRPSRCLKHSVCPQSTSWWKRLSQSPSNSTIMSSSKWETLDFNQSTLETLSWDIWPGLRKLIKSTDHTRDKATTQVSCPLLYSVTCWRTPSGIHLILLTRLKSLRAVLRVYSTSKRWSLIWLAWTFLMPRFWMKLHPARKLSLLHTLPTTVSAQSSMFQTRSSHKTLTLFRLVATVTESRLSLGPSLTSPGTRPNNIVVCWSRIQIT